MSPLDHAARQIAERERTIASLCSRLEYTERRLAALREEKRQHLRAQHGIVQCEACEAVIDTSSEVFGEGYVSDAEGCYLCAACHVEALRCDAQRDTIADDLADGVGAR